MRIKWENIVGLVVVIIVLANLKVISKTFQSIYQWFAESLDGLNNFPEGAKAAIAFCSVLLVVVMVFKLIQK
jgi:hypothetical protein